MDIVIILAAMIIGGVSVAAGIIQGKVDSKRGDFGEWTKGDQEKLEKGLIERIEW